MRIRTTSYIRTGALIAAVVFCATGCDFIYGILPFLKPSPTPGPTTAQGTALDPVTQEVLSVSSTIGNLESVLSARSEVELFDAADGGSGGLRIQGLEGHPAFPCGLPDVTFDDERGRKIQVASSCNGSTLVRTMSTLNASGSAVPRATQSISVAFNPEPQEGTAGSGEAVLTETIVRSTGRGNFGGGAAGGPGGATQGAAPGEAPKIERLRRGTYVYDPAAMPSLSISIQSESAKRSETTTGAGAGGLAGLGGGLPGGATQPRPRPGGGQFPGAGGSPRPRPSGAFAGAPGQQAGTQQRPTPGKVVETLIATDFAAPRVASAPAWMPRRVASRVVADAVETNSASTTTFHWEAQGNRWDGLTLAGSLTDPDGKTSTFTGFRSADGAANETWQLSNGHRVEAKTPAGGTRSLVITDGAGKPIATVTTDNGQILINGKPITQGMGAAQPAPTRQPGSGVVDE